jgi:hypothetical protein
VSLTDGLTQNIWSLWRSFHSLSPHHAFFPV